MYNNSNNNGVQHPILYTFFTMLLIIFVIIIILAVLHPHLFITYFGTPRNLSFVGSLQLILDYVVALFEHTIASL